MKKHFRMLLLLSALLLLVPPRGLSETSETSVAPVAAATAEPAAQEDAVVAMVNGEPLLASDYKPVETTYLLEYANMGCDVTDESVKAYVQDLALTAAIEDLLVHQDMKAQGFYTFDDQTERWIAEQGAAAYEAALANVSDTLRAELSLTEEDDITPYALAYAELLGVTVADYEDVYRTQLATVAYNDWLTRDIPVTDEQIAAAYDAYVAENGPAELTEELREALAASLYQQRWQERLAARVDELAESAEVVFP